MSFVKSADTKTPVASSRAEIEKMLRRYGAIGFNVQQTFSDAGMPESVRVEFIVPDKPGSKARVPVSLPVNVQNVALALFGEPKSQWAPSQSRHIKAYSVAQYERAERVAWRNLVLWIDAALSASTIGLQTITEAFYAHTVIQLEDGRRARLSEYIENTQGQLAPGVRALLASPESK